MTEQRKKRLKTQLLESRARLRYQNGAFADPLYEMLFVATKEVYRISTNGSCIYFDPDWLQRLGPVALDFILSHQLMHIALGHIDRPTYYAGERFHLACDIVANSHLEVLGWRIERIPSIGRIFHETFYPETPGRLLTAREAMARVPFDPATLDPSVSRSYMIDSDRWWTRREDRGAYGEIVLRPGDEDPFTQEETGGGEHYYFPKEYFDKKNESDAQFKPDLPNHYPEGSWENRAKGELENLRSSFEGDPEQGFGDGMLERIWIRAQSSRIDWRMLLDSFVQEEIFDYSFMPPDRRMQDAELLLPDYNLPDQQPMEVLFMVDTSGSVEDEALCAVYGEICHALEQFNGGLVGRLSFFDVRVSAPVSFSDVSDLLRIKPRGGGGTDYRCVFDYIRRETWAQAPTNVVILTDGRAEFPEEAEAGQIPVLWLLTDRAKKPPFGKYAYVTVD